MKRIKYICYYNFTGGKEDRRNLNSAVTKIDYIISLINKSGYYVDIISKTPQSINRPALSAGKHVVYDNGNTLSFFASLGFRNNIFIYAISRAINTLHFLFWLFFNCKRGEEILVYHSLGYCMTLFLLKKIKGIKFIGEIEEIYKDVNQGGFISHFCEQEFIKCCDKYILPTELLNKKINVSKKQNVIIHGVYTIEKVISTKFNDNIIHVVYGGTLNPDKGSIEAARAVAYLPSNFFVHICGTGTPQQINNITKIVNELKGEGFNNIQYEGNLSANCYKKFIQKCHIGLCTQNPNAEFTSTSFPSKILMYMSNGLSVVSIKIPTISDSLISKAICFYETQDPESIAGAILKCSESKISPSINLLNRLHEKALIDVENLLN